MSKINRWLAFVAILALGVCLGLYLQSTAAAKQEKPAVKLMAPKLTPAKWEYKVVPWTPGSEASAVCEDKLNKLGEEGYEIASVEPLQQFGTFYYTMKRIKKD